jgi:hypothetical protein
MQWFVLNMEKESIVILNRDRLKRSIDLDKKGILQQR